MIQKILGMFDFLLILIFGLFLRPLRDGISTYIATACGRITGDLGGGCRYQFIVWHYLQLKMIEVAILSSIVSGVR